MIVDGKRALAYIQTVHDIQNVEGADNIQRAFVLGWEQVIKKGEFQEGEKCVFFEIDSKLPENDERYAFMASKGYKVKTFKLKKFGMLGQGLALPLSEFPELGDLDIDTDVTETLKITYSNPEDNSRKASGDKFQSLRSRKPNLFKKPFIKWLMKRKWGRGLVFFLFGKKKDKKTSFPSEYCSKTDEERVQNMPWILENKDPFIVTEKLDGTSTTFVYVKKKKEFIVSSRNVRQVKPDQKTYFDLAENVYWGSAKKYNVEDTLKDLLKKHPESNYVVLQGETYGANLQGNPLKQTDIKFAGFNLYFGDDKGRTRLGSVEAKEIMAEYNIPWVPIIYTDYILPDTVSELLDAATGPSIVNDKVLREGWVIRSKDGQTSFKAVSPEYLIKKGE